MCHFWPWFYRCKGFQSRTGNKIIMSFLFTRYGEPQFSTSDVKQNLSAKWDRKDWYTCTHKIKEQPQHFPPLEVSLGTLGWWRVSSLVLQILTFCHFSPPFSHVTTKIHPCAITFPIIFFLQHFLELSLTSTESMKILRLLPDLNHEFFRGVSD